MLAPADQRPGVAQAENVGHAGYGVARYDKRPTEGVRGNPTGASGRVGGPQGGRLAI